jgi:hypothetical protein
MDTKTNMDKNPFKNVYAGMSSGEMKSYKLNLSVIKNNENSKLHLPKNSGENVNSNSIDPRNVKLTVPQELNPNSYISIDTALTLRGVRNFVISLFAKFSQPLPGEGCENLRKLIGFFDGMRKSSQSQKTTLEHCQEAPYLIMNALEKDGINLKKSDLSLENIKREMIEFIEKEGTKKPGQDEPKRRG